jgi:ubiquinone biosynthesis protein COQ4
MNEVKVAKQAINHQREEALRDAFLGMVRSPDGDFGALDRLGQASSDLESLQSIISNLKLSEQGKLAFETYPRLGEVKLEQLAALPPNSLGFAYAEHMQSNGLKPLSIKPSNNDYEFLGAHLTETHDIWHVVTGFNTNILGELKLEALYVSQFPHSRFWLALVTKNLLKTVLHDIEKSTEYMDELTEGWTTGKYAKPLFGIDWKTLWAKPLHQIREDLNLKSFYNLMKSAE